MKEHKKIEHKKIEEILREVGSKLDHLVEQTKHLEGNVRKEIEKKVKSLRTHKKKIEDQLSLWKGNIQPRFEAAKPHVLEMAKELRETVRAFLRKPH